MANITTLYKDTKLYVNLSGEIDQHTAIEIRAEIDKAIDNYKPQNLILNFKDVSFMDSSGVGLIMGRYKKLATCGGKLIIVDLPRSCERIISMSGITKVLDIKENTNEQF